MRGLIVVAGLVLGGGLALPLTGCDRWVQSEGIELKPLGSAVVVVERNEEGEILIKDLVLTSVVGYCDKRRERRESDDEAYEEFLAGAVALDPPASTFDDPRVCELYSDYQEEVGALSSPTSPPRSWRLSMWLDSDVEREIVLGLASDAEQEWLPPMHEWDSLPGEGQPARGFWGMLSTYDPLAPGAVRQGLRCDGSDDQYTYEWSHLRELSTGQLSVRAAGPDRLEISLRSADVAPEGVTPGGTWLTPPPEFEPDGQVSARATLRLCELE